MCNQQESDGNKDTGVFILCCLVSSVHALTWTECPTGDMDVAHGDQLSITCTGLVRSFGYTWSLTTPSAGELDRIIGTCESCLQSPCRPCAIDDTVYNITRRPNNSGSDVSTVEFVTKHNATIRCARSGDLTGGVTCRLNVLRGSTETTSPTDTGGTDRAGQSTVSATQTGGPAAGLTSSSLQHEYPKVTAHTTWSKSRQASTKGASSGLYIMVGIGVATLLGISAGVVAAAFFWKRSTGRHETTSPNATTKGQQDNTPAEHLSAAPYAPFKASLGGGSNTGQQDNTPAEHLSAAPNTPSTVSLGGVTNTSEDSEISEVSETSEADDK